MFSLIFYFTADGDKKTSKNTTKDKLNLKPGDNYSHTVDPVQTQSNEVQILNYIINNILYQAYILNRLCFFFSVCKQFYRK